jgi:2-dehydropantoate 2-reductase
MSAPAPAPRSDILAVGVMGAGAVGCFVGGLAARPGVEVVLVGREALGHELRDAGLCVVDLDGAETRVTTRDLGFDTEPTALAPCDVVLCCVKSLGTEDAARTMAEVLRPGALVVSLQNGVRNVDILRAHLPRQEVLAGVVGFNVVARGHGVYRQTTKGALLVERSDDPRAGRLWRALRAAGLRVTEHRDLVPHQWAKLLANLGNAVSGLSGAPTGEMLLSVGCRRVLAETIAEALRVLRGAGISPAPLQGIPVGLLPPLLRLPTPVVRLVARAQLRADPEARSSLFQDLARGRRTEIDFLNGEIVRLAEARGVDAPLNRRVVALVHEVEERGQGSPRMSGDALWARVSGSG